MNLSDFNLSNFKQDFKNNLLDNLLDSFLVEIQNHLNKSEQNLHSLSNTKYFTVDRIEENYAILENRSNKELSNIPITELPSNIRNGQILELKNNLYYINYELTEQISNEIKEKSDKLFK